MNYPLLLVFHLFAALVFIGTVFFEVLMLEGVRAHVSAPAFREVEQAIGKRARRVMPWVMLVLYGAGAGLAWHYRSALAHPLESSFATLLTLKALLALSVLGHFIRAMTWLIRDRMTSRRYRIIHISVFCHLVAIVLLAKGMLYVSW